MANNYTLGRGELWFAQYKPGTQEPGGERYFGNTPEINFTIESETLDHFNSDRGINEKDASIVLSTNRTGSFITDNIDPHNIALFFFGSVSNFTEAGGSVSDEEIADVEPGLTYQLGMSPTNPVGAFDLDETDPVEVKDDTTPDPNVYVAGTDYTIDYRLGRLTILEGGSITKGKKLLVSYKTKAGTRPRIISGSSAIEGALRYIEYNPVGKNKIWYMPYVKVSPNGDYALKGDEWQQIPFSLEILKKSNMEAIYIDGQPLAV